MTTIKTTASRSATDSFTGVSVNRLARAVGAAWTSLRNRSQVRRLAELDDHLLADIGLTRSDVEEASSMPITTDPSIQLAAVAMRNTARPRGRRGDAYGSGGQA